LRHGVKVKWRCTRWPTVPGWSTVAETANQVGIPESWLREQLRLGRVRTWREASGRYLFPNQAYAHLALLQLRSGTVCGVEFAPSVPQKKGHQDA
jgi:hypothetical protein